jgi:hypothetical protein
MTKALTPEEITRYKAIYGPPSVLSTESVEDYERLFDAVIAAVQPRNIIEFIPVRHFVSAEWMINRYTRHATLIIERRYNDYRRSAVVFAKDSGIGKSTESRVAIAALKGSDQEFATLSDRIYGSDMTMKEVIKVPPKEMDHNRALEFSVAIQEQLHGMIARQTAIRNDCLRQLELYRAGLGKELEKARKEIVDAEFSEVRAQPALIAAPPIIPEQIEVQNDNAPASSGQSEQ